MACVFLNTREVYLNTTIKNKKVTVIFREPFATIEKLVKLAKQGIAEVGLAEFKSAIISSKNEYFQSIKKRAFSALDFKWWTLTNDLKLEVTKIA